LVAVETLRNTNAAGNNETPGEKAESGGAWSVICTRPKCREPDHSRTNDLGCILPVARTGSELATMDAHRHTQNTFCAARSQNASAASKKFEFQNVEMRIREDELRKRDE